MQKLITHLKRRKKDGIKWIILHGLAVWGTRIAIVIGATYAVFAMLYTVWLPHEIVKLYPHQVTGRTNVVAYILADDPSGRITLLDANSRQIVRYLDSSVASIRDCRPIPRGGWSDITNASTLWASITNNLPVKFLHPVNTMPCPGGRETLPRWWGTMTLDASAIIARVVTLWGLCASPAVGPAWWKRRTLAYSGGAAIYHIAEINS